jgi:rod shape-determining protein MreD
MKPTLLAVPVLGILTMLQTAIVSRITLLHGSADLVMLALLAWSLHQRVQNAWFWALLAGIFFSIASALPLGAMPAGYLLATGLTLVLKRRVWQAPILAMFVATFGATLITQGISIASLTVSGANLAIIDALNMVTLPSLLLNLLLAVPMFVFIGDLAAWAYPQEMEI